MSSFHRTLSDDSPPLAVIEEADVQEIAPAGGPRVFAIQESRDEGSPHTPIPPDVATCPGCLEEILGPGERRYRSPFTNCTNCGPRFTITTRVPYDRPHTTMSVTEGEDKPLKYPLMFRACELVIVNKIDLLPYLDYELDLFLGNLTDVNPGVQHMLVSARTGAGIDGFGDWLEDVTFGRGRQPQR